MKFVNNTNEIIDSHQCTFKCSLTKFYQKQKYNIVKAHYSKRIFNIYFTKFVKKELAQS